MPLTKQKKENIIKDIEEKLEKQKSMIFIDFANASVKELTEIRNKLKNEGNEMKVAKKNLIQIAFKNKKIDLDIKKLSGEIAIIFGYEDEIKPAKTIYQLTKNKKNKIIGGWIGNTYYESEKIISLAQLPGKEQLLGMLLGTLNAPITNFVNVLEGNIKNFVYALSAIKDKK
jgi:large subunit ribosomal protein L10